MSGTEQSGPEWRAVETEFGVDLYGVVRTVEGPYAVGGSGTLAADRGDGWEVVFDDGPATRQAQLRAVDATDDGRRVWLVGSSGVLACYDVEQRRKFDYSYPDEMTSTWEAVAVSGRKGHEKVLAANGSGEVLPFTVHGFDVDWGRLAKPAAKGSNIAALAASPDGVGYAIDTSGNAFTTSADEGWTDIGILDAQRKLYDVYAGHDQRVYVTAGDGNVYRYDDSAGDWTPIGVDDGVALRAIDVAIDDEGNGEMVVVGANGSLYQRTGQERWREQPSPVDATLFDLTVGSHTDVVVGKNGTVVERPREPRHAGSSPDGDAYDGRGETYDRPTDQRRAPRTGDGDRTGGSGGGDEGQETSAGRGDDRETNAGGSADAEASASLDNEEVLVLLAQNLDIGDLSSASGYNIDAVERALVDLAADAGADTARVRAAVESGD